MHKNIFLLLCSATLALAAPHVSAKVTPEEAAQLGKNLTPVGAERAGNKDGTIPEWKPLPQSGPLKSEFFTRPEIDSQPALLTLTRDNMAQYADKLTKGHQYLLKTYADYKMNVYPSHRLAGWPEEIYKATADNALSCSITGTDILDGCKLGFPFPIPKSGAEPIWNHKLKWRGEAVTRYNNQMIVQPTAHRS